VRGSRLHIRDDKYQNRALKSSIFSLDSALSQLLSRNEVFCTISPKGVSDDLDDIESDLETDRSRSGLHHQFRQKAQWLHKTSFRDNNWLSAESREKIETLKERDSDTYHHVYEGATRSTVEGAIYKAEIQQAEKKDGRIRQIPYDPMQASRYFLGFGLCGLRG